ncbi:molybdopterin-containing oxidoreductase family protein [Bradyrhizobium betae]|uniref:molybdopterin-containing oxidoreductase family protein n=1 Tax=Bradyrhizobium betae TaxID=244734 RepID=UPI003D66ACC7
MPSSSFVKTACPHDCPSACALEVERLSSTKIGRVRGSAGNSYTSGICCTKVSRYAERVHHPARLAQPMRRVGPKGSGEFAPIGWTDALDEIADRFTRATQTYGSEAVWPYHSGGNMGVIQRWGLDRLRHAFRYSRQQTTICVTPAESGWKAGVGELRGCDPREMAEADLILMWGGNPVSTQVNAMTHIARARKRGAKLIVVDVYRTPTIAAADIAVIVRPGTDAALALGMMHVLLKEGFADEAYLARLTDFDGDVRRHIQSWTPERAAQVTGVDVAQIVDIARLYGQTRRSFLRLGFGFTRSRNGAASMHTVTCLPAITGSWQHKGGGAFFLALDNWRLDTTLAHGLDMRDPHTRILDQSRIGAILTGDPVALKDGPPVAAMIMQNANSANVAPDSRKVAQGLGREDLFLCVHEQFMTPTARYADIVLPAAMFLEADDIYYGLGHTYITAGPRVLDRYRESWTNHEVVCGIAQRLGSDHPSFRMSAFELIDKTLSASGRGTAAEAFSTGWVECAESFDDAHFSNRFPTSDGKFHFKPDWTGIGPNGHGMRALPDFMENYEVADDEHPFRLVAPPARTFLNTTFTEIDSSRKREGAPQIIIHPDDAARHGVTDAEIVQIGNRRGRLELPAKIDLSGRPGVVIVEGIWPNTDFSGGLGVNQLIGDDPVPPNGGSAFHDTAVWMRRLSQ